MKYASNVVSLHPYFKIRPGNVDEARASLQAFVDKTESEKANLYYEFTMNGDELFCREAYVGAEGVLAHLENVGGLLGELLKIADLVRLEVHGPEKELEKLKVPLGAMNPAWFVLQCGVKRAE